MRIVPLVNDIIVWKHPGTEVKERILWIDEGNVIAYLIELFKPTGFPRKVKISDIAESIIRDEAERLNTDPYIRFITESELSSKELELRNSAWEVVSYIMSHVEEPSIFQRNIRGPIVKEAAEKYSLTVDTVYSYLRKFWQRGKNKNSLLPDYHNSGGKGKEKTTGEKKRGRPRKFSSEIGEGLNVSQDIRRIFRIAYDEYYNTRKSNTLRHSYMMMVNNFFRENIYFENGIQKVVLLDQNQIPTFTQYHYWVRKEEDLKNSLIARKGKNKFNLEHRAVLDRSDRDSIGPGSRFQIDATVADVYLVSRYNKKWIIGRPVIYAVIDVFSRMIAGVYIGLEGPSWLGAAMALANCAMNKVEFCKQYEIDIESEEWPVQGLPEAILADRGEMEGHSIETLSNSLHVRIENTPPYRADWKGIIEQYFHTVNVTVKPFLPGFVDVDFKQRGGRDYRLDAKLDIYHFTRIIIKSILYHNNSHWMKDYNRQEMAVTEDVLPMPIHLWNWGMKNFSGHLRSFPEDIVKLNLMPIGKASVTENGIKFKRMRYSCQRALKEMWFEQARNRHGWTLDVSFDPRNMNYIYIRENGGRTYEPCHLLESEGRYRDRTLAEIEYLFNYESLSYQQREVKLLEKEINLANEILAEVKEAEKAVPQASERESKAERVQGIKGNRKEEKFRNRELEAFVLTAEQGKFVENSSRDNQPIVHNKPNSQEDYNEPSDIELLRRKQREKLFGGNNTHDR